jgi:DNA-binding transcriptional MerR regulator
MTIETNELPSGLSSTARRVDGPKTYTIIYDARDRARLAVILKGKQLGFTLTEIRAMVAEERGGEVPAANLKLSLDQVDDQIRHLEQQKVDIEQALVELKAHRDGLVAAAA